MGELETLLKKIEELFSEQYSLGEKAAMSRILQVAKDKQPAAGSSQMRRGAKRRYRAPKGAPRAFVARVLEDSGTTGVSAQDIVKQARSVIEKSISLSAVRLELYRGQKEGRYRSNKGKWTVTRAGRTAA